MPARLLYEDHEIQSLDQETVLDALLRVGLEVPFSCKGGACHTCLMQCVEGELPARAQAGLPAHLARLHYFLPCQCQASGTLRMRPPQPADLLTPCTLCEISGHGSDTLTLIFEPQRPLRYRTGQTLRLVAPSSGAGEQPEARIVLRSDPHTDWLLQGELRLMPAAPGQPAPVLPEGFGPDAEFGLSFEVRGPFDERPPQPLPAPSADPELWAELGHGSRVRAVLEDFYPKVYAHPQLAPFFSGVTQQHAIDKQYAFMRLRLSGEKVDFVDHPRNAHHWMIITHALFDLRQQLMEETLREHGLSDAQRQRWMRVEEHYRPDMVKDRAWPRLSNGLELNLEGFSREQLSEGSLCDHCGEAVEPGTEVLYHLRTGRISCPNCMTRSAEHSEASRDATT